MQVFHDCVLREEWELNDQFFNLYKETTQREPNFEDKLTSNVQPTSEAPPTSAAHPATIPKGTSSAAQVADPHACSAAPTACVGVPHGATCAHNSPDPPAPGAASPASAAGSPLPGGASSASPQFQPAPKGAAPPISPPAAPAARAAADPNVQNAPTTHNPPAPGAASPPSTAGSPLPGGASSASPKFQPAPKGAASPTSPLAAPAARAAAHPNVQPTSGAPNGNASAAATAAPTCSHALPEKPPWQQVDEWKLSDDECYKLLLLNTDIPIAQREVFRIDKTHQWCGSSRTSQLFPHLLEVSNGTGRCLLYLSDNIHYRTMFGVQGTWWLFDSLNMFQGFKPVLEHLHLFYTTRGCSSPTFKRIALHPQSDYVNCSLWAEWSTREWTTCTLAEAKDFGHTLVTRAAHIGVSNLGENPCSMHATPKASANREFILRRKAAFRGNAHTPGVIYCTVGPYQRRFEWRAAMNEPITGPGKTKDDPVTLFSSDDDDDAMPAPQLHASPMPAQAEHLPGDGHATPTTGNADACASPTVEAQPIHCASPTITPAGKSEMPQSKVVEAGASELQLLSAKALHHGVAPPSVAHAATPGVPPSTPATSGHNKRAMNKTPSPVHVVDLALQRVRKLVGQVLGEHARKTVKVTYSKGQNHDKNGIITFPCPRDTAPKLLDLIALHDQSYFVCKGTKYRNERTNTTRVVYKCYRHGEAFKAHGVQPKSLTHQKRLNTKSVKCGCKAWIAITTSAIKDIAKFRLQLHHTGHKPGKAKDRIHLPLRKEVKTKLTKLAKICPRNYLGMRRVVREYVENKLAPQLGLGFKVKENDGRFTPSRKDIRNVVHKYAGTYWFSNSDQENSVMYLCSEQECSWVFRPYRGGHACLEYTPNEGLQLTLVDAELQMHHKMLSEKWDYASMQSIARMVLDCATSAQGSSDPPAPGAASPASAAASPSTDGASSAPPQSQPAPNAGTSPVAPAADAAARPGVQPTSEAHSGHASTAAHPTSIPKGPSSAPHVADPHACSAAPTACMAVPGGAAYAHNLPDPPAPGAASPASAAASPLPSSASLAPPQFQPAPNAGTSPVAPAADAAARPGVQPTSEAHSGHASTAAHPATIPKGTSSAAQVADPHACSAAPTACAGVPHGATCAHNSPDPPAPGAASPASAAGSPLPGGASSTPPQFRPAPNAGTSPVAPAAGAAARPDVQPTSEAHSGHASAAAHPATSSGANADATSYSFTPSSPSPPSQRHGVDVVSTIHEMETSNSHLSNGHTLIVMMSTEQKRMLALHGSIIGMDATYRTQKWGLPFFMIVVITAQGEGYPAVYFWVSSETTEAIAEALLFIKRLVPNWQPGVMIVDHSAAEVGAIEIVFPNVYILLCDFHIKQAWQRWLKAECSSYKEEVYTLLVNIAHSSDVREKAAALSALEAFLARPENAHVKSWFNNHYAKCIQSWCKADRALIFTRGIRTNNFNEPANATIKNWLSTRSDFKVASCLEMLYTTITPEADLKHGGKQVQELDVIFKESLDAALLPERKLFPYVVYKQMEKRLRSSREVPMEVTAMLGAETVYQVKTDGGCYTANVTQGTCTCPDFLQHRIPCKHMFRALAVCGKSITVLPDKILKAPHVTFDLACSSNTCYETAYTGAWDASGDEGSTPKVKQHSGGVGVSEGVDNSGTYAEADPQMEHTTSMSEAIMERNWKIAIKEATTLFYGNKDEGDHRTCAQMLIQITTVLDSGKHGVAGKLCEMEDVPGRRVKSRKRGLTGRPAKGPLDFASEGGGGRKRARPEAGEYHRERGPGRPKKVGKSGLQVWGSGPKEMKKCKRDGCRVAVEGWKRFCEAHTNSQKCIISGCGKVAVRGAVRCRSHHSRQKPATRFDRWCLTRGCMQTVHGKAKYCKGHRKNSTTFVARRCLTEGCVELAERARTRCKTHLGDARQKKEGKPREPKRCRQTGCTESASEAGFFCRAHGEPKQRSRGASRRCVEEGCSKVAQANMRYCKAHNPGVMQRFYRHEESVRRQRLLESKKRARERTEQVLADRLRGQSE
jgi:hypothetical protein